MGNENMENAAGFLVFSVRCSSSLRFIDICKRFVSKPYFFHFMLNVS